jgi:Na+/H+ antiporter NhaD/arsenite permease-like protein
VPIEFVLFALVLAGVALFHRHTMPIALGGAVVIALYKVLFSPFRTGAGIPGLGLHLQHEWVILVNLLLLLLGFALLADLFEKSQVPAALPNYLPDDWKGGFVLLVAVFVLSSFLDNIAAAMIGGAVAHTVFRGKVHIGYLAAIVAASNGGGAGSVVGDTTTTMMWIAGVHPLEVLEGFIGSAIALVVFGIPAAFQQQRHSPIVKDAEPGLRIDSVRVAIVAFVLIAAIVVNIVIKHPLQRRRRPLPLPRRGRLSGDRRVRGAAPAELVAPAGRVQGLGLPALPGAVRLDDAGRAAAGCFLADGARPRLPLGGVRQHPPDRARPEAGGYDWGFLAYAVGFGGSMIWFGSSAGVALTNMYPEGKSVGKWLRHGWPIALAYVIGYCAMLAVIGFHPGSVLKGSVGAG